MDDDLNRRLEDLTRAATRGLRIPPPDVIARRARYLRLTRAVTGVAGSLALVGLVAVGFAMIPARDPAPTGDQPSLDSAEPSVTTSRSPVQRPPASRQSSAATALPHGDAASVGCRSSQLHLSSGTASTEGGHHHVTYYLTNTGPATCTIAGFPSVAVLDRQGHSIGHPATRYGDPVTRVSLHPRQRTQFELTSANVGFDPQCDHLAQGTTLRVYPPNQTTPLQLPGSFSACGLIVGAVKLA
jgi:hypothetical protein